MQLLQAEPFHPQPPEGGFGARADVPARIGLVCEDVRRREVEPHERRDAREHVHSLLRSLARKDVAEQILGPAAARYLDGVHAALDR